MARTEIIKKKQKKKTENKRADLPISMGGTRTDGTTAESWDWKMANPRIDEPYKEQYRKEGEEQYRKKMEREQGARSGKSPESKPAKKIEPMEPDKPLEKNPNYQTELKKEDQRNRKIKKTAKRKGMKSDAERIKKGEEMSKLYGGWLGKEMPGTKKKKSSRHAPATGKQAVEEFYERVDRAKDRGEPAAKAYHRDKGHKAWRKKAINRHKGNK